MTIKPPKLETRVAILMKKAEQAKIKLPYNATFFITQHIRSNMRELGGALKRVITHLRFVGRPITIELIRELLEGLSAFQDKLVSINNIQHIAAGYCKIKISDLLSERHSRSMACSRQVAMMFPKKLTSHNLPEVGVAFGDRGHTTVLYTCRKIAQLRESNVDVREDYKNLLRTLIT